LLGAGLPRRALARLRPRGVRGLPGGVRGAAAPFRDEDLMQDLFDDDLFVEEEAPKPPRRRSVRSKRRRTGETARRILFALPWVVFAIVITVAGGLVFAIAMIGLSVLCVREYLA